MNKTTELNGTEAGIVIQALEDWVAKTNDRGNRLIDGTNNRGAGFRCFDDAKIGEAIRDRLDELFPVVE